MTIRSIRIKPSHRGRLHEDLGVPIGQKIPRSLIEQALTSNDPAVRARARFAHAAAGFNHSSSSESAMKRRRSHRGEVTSISAHHSDPKFMRVEVAHGKRKKSAKDNYDDRPTSTIVIPKHHAQHYRIGDQLNVGLTHSGMNPGAGDNESTEPMPDDEDAEDSYQSMKQGLVRGSVR